MAEIAHTLNQTNGKSDTARFQANVKLDVKLYPTFSGKIEEWYKFKRGVLALAATHGLTNVFYVMYPVPAYNCGDDWILYKEQNTFKAYISIKALKASR